MREGSQQSNLVGETPLGNGAPGSVADSVIVWEKTYEYRAETVTMLSPEKTMPPNNPETQIEGDDTPEIKVFTHDVFPPTVPTGLQAAASGPGQKTFIDLVWAPGTDADLDGYNVYRHHGSAAPERINTALVKSPAYRDEAVAPGNQYSYSVSAVDAYAATRSARSDEMPAKRYPKEVQTKKVCHFERSRIAPFRAILRSRETCFSRRGY